MDLRTNEGRRDPDSTFSLRGAVRTALTSWRERWQAPESTFKPWRAPESTFKLRAAAVDPRAGSDAPPAPASEPGPSGAPRMVSLVEGSGAHLSAATRSLLQDRLRAAALLLLAIFALFLARILFGVFPAREAVDGRIVAYRIAMLALQGAVVALLSSRAQLTLRALRTIELVMFGLVAAFLAGVQYENVAYCAERGDEKLAVVATKNTVVFTFALLVIYGMFIPNKWRRALAVVAAIAVVPVAVQALLLARYPALLESVGLMTSPARVTENLMILLSGVAISVYGTYTINALRVEAFEARRLGQYQLRERIGAGAMGEVYLAEHQLLKRPCALKLIQPGEAADPTALARFAREVRTTARLSHPNTIEIYDYGRTEDGTFYYAMEYLRGLSLDDLVERYGPLPPGRVIYLLRQASEALAEAHAAGLIHRDLKPANIFAAERGGRHDFVKILDFGLVKTLAADPAEAKLSREGSITGTPLYMSPEQALGDPTDARSDLYSLGAVTYYLLTGRPPFPGESATRVMLAHARDPVPPPSQIRPDVPEDLERIVLRCLAKPPSERFQDAESLERALAACAAAADWDAHQAARWWREHPQGPRPQPAATLAPAGA
ncbi:MAG: serine/threonine-protein kinase [Planctomycetaceae bacterium]